MSEFGYLVNFDPLNPQYILSVPTDIQPSGVITVKLITIERLGWNWNPITITLTSPAFTAVTGYAQLQDTITPAGFPVTTTLPPVGDDTITIIIAAGGGKDLDLTYSIQLKKPCVGQCCEGGAFAPPTKLCRAASGACDMADYCTGNSPDCPADAKAVDGTTCKKVVLHPPRPRNSYPHGDESNTGGGYQGRYAELRAVTTTSQGADPTAVHSHGFRGDLRGSYGRLPPKDWYRHCPGTCQAGVCTLSSEQHDRCFDY